MFGEQGSWKWSWLIALALVALAGCDWFGSPTAAKCDLVAACAASTRAPGYYDCDVLPTSDKTTYSVNGGARGADSQLKAVPGDTVSVCQGTCCTVLVLQ